MPPNQALFLASDDEPSQLLSSTGEPLPAPEGVQRVGILGTGMMGREHCSYLMGYPYDARIDFLCDPVRFFTALSAHGMSYPWPSFVRDIVVVRDTLSYKAHPLLVALRSK
jgi:hypothetical protein